MSADRKMLRARAIEARVGPRIAWYVNYWQRFGERLWGIIVEGADLLSRVQGVVNKYTVKYFDEMVLQIIF